MDETNMRSFAISPVGWAVYDELVRFPESSNRPAFAGLPYEAPTAENLFRRPPHRVMHELPANFVSNELAELDADDDAQLLQFMREWGVLTHPLRKTEIPFLYPGEVEGFKAIATTDEVLRERIRVRKNNAVLNSKTHV